MAWGTTSFFEKKGSYVIGSVLVLFPPPGKVCAEESVWPQCVGTARLAQVSFFFLIIIFSFLFF